MDQAISRRRPEQHTEKAHAPGGTWLRDSILGLNDGLVAAFAVTSGVAAAFSSQKVVVMAGLSEMLGGAVSMGLASYASARAQYEFYRSEEQREHDEINRWPDRERDEVRAIYRQKGFGGALLDQIVAHITADKTRWRNVMMREELGFGADATDPPSRSAGIVGAAYLVGGGAAGALPDCRAAGGNPGFGDRHRPHSVSRRRDKDPGDRASMVAQRTREHGDRCRSRAGDVWRRPLFRRSLDFEHHVIARDRDRILTQAHRGIINAAAGREIVFPSVQGTDHAAAVNLAVTEGTAFVKAGVGDRVKPGLVVEKGDLRSLHLDHAAGALRDEIQRCDLDHSTHAEVR